MRLTWHMVLVGVFIFGLMAMAWSALSQLDSAVGARSVAHSRGVDPGQLPVVPQASFGRDCGVDAPEQPAANPRDSKNISPVRPDRRWVFVHQGATGGSVLLGPGQSRLRCSAPGFAPVR